MSELVRRRNARDLWISRSHLAAAGVGIAALVVASFATGFLAGQRHTPVPVATVAPPAPDAALVELLARVDASGAAHGAVDSLTYPDALRQPGGAVPHVPQAQPPGIRRIVLPGGTDGPRWTVVVGRSPDAASAEQARDRLTERGLAAWTLEDGASGFRVVVGAFDTAEEAAAALPVVAAAGASGVVEAIRPAERAAPPSAPVPEAPAPAPAPEPPRPQ